MPIVDEPALHTASYQHALRAAQVAALAHANLVQSTTDKIVRRASFQRELAAKRAARDAWSAEQHYRLSHATCILPRLLGAGRPSARIRYGQCGTPSSYGGDDYYMFDHRELWRGAGRYVAITAHIYGFSQEWQIRTQAMCDQLGIDLRVVPPPLGWYGHGTTLLIYRRRLAAATGAASTNSIGARQHD